MEVLGVDRVKRTFFLFLIFDFFLFLFLFIADSKENERSFHTFPLELGRLFAPIREGRIPRDQVSISLSLRFYYYSSQVGDGFRYCTQLPLKKKKKNVSLGFDISCLFFLFFFIIVVEKRKCGTSGNYQ